MEYLTYVGVLMYRFILFAGHFELDLASTREKTGAGEKGPFPPPGWQ